MTFRVGQKVVCVDPVDELVKGNIYTISRMGSGALTGMCDVAEITTPVSIAWFVRRFRPVLERQTDISFAHEILRKASKPARAPAFSSPHHSTGEA